MLPHFLLNGNNLDVFKQIKLIELENQKKNNLSHNSKILVASMKFMVNSTGLIYKDHAWISLHFWFKSNKLYQPTTYTRPQ